MGVRLAGIDLNLLTSLDALLEERTVTGAARRLGVTQPAASHALRRLREQLGDPLLVRTREGMRATPRALALRPAVRAALEAAAAVLDPPPAFDPATADRTFAISTVDQAAFVLLPPLLARLAREAPRVQIVVRPVAADRLDDALADDLDLSIGVFRDAPANFHTAPLWKETFACVVRRGSPASRGPFDLRRYASLTHLLVSPRGTPGSFIDDALAKAGFLRRIVLLVPHFLVAPRVVAETDLVWTAPAGLARALAGEQPITIRDLPLAVDGFTVALRWHARVDGDPGLAWLRTVLRDVAPR